MISVDNILVPVDFSPGSELALRYARFLADRFGAVLHVLHVWDLPDFLIPDTMVGGPPEESESVQLGEVVESEAERRLRDFVRDVHPQDLQVRLEFGSPSHKIIEVAHTQDIDLIVMATAGRLGLSAMLVSSCAAKVMRGAPCPVLTVRADQHLEVASAA